MPHSIPTTRTENSIIRLLVGDWFTDNFESGAIMDVETASGSRYHIEIEPGKVEGLRAPVYDLFYYRRKATITRNGVKLEAMYVGFYKPSATLAAIGSNDLFSRVSHSIVKLTHLETVTPGA